MKKWLSAAIFFALSGCSVMQESPITSESDLNAEQALTPRVNRNSVIDEEVLYLLMAGELAGQRNQLDLALDAYLQAAKRVDDGRIAERAVKIAMFLKDDKRTKEALAVWMVKDSQNLAARKFAFLMAIKNSDYSAAVEHLNVIFLEDPAGFENGTLEIIKALEKEGRTQFIYDVLEQIAQRHPDQASIMFVQAVTGSVLHDSDLAQRKISRALELQPNWGKALVFQAQLAGRNGDNLKAKEYLEKAIKVSPEDRQLKKMLIEVMVNMEMFDEASRFCQSIIDENPEDSEMLFMMALIHLQQNQVDKGENFLEKLLSDPGWEGQAAFYLGKIEQDRQHMSKAVQWFDRAVEAGYGFEASMASLSLVIGQKRFDEVSDRLKAMEIKYPDQHQKIVLARAELFTQLGQHQQAFDELTKAINDTSENRDILYARALVAERLDKIDSMEVDLKKILHRNPDDVGALNALGYSLADRSIRLEEAERYLEKAIGLEPDEAVIIDSYGWLLFKLGRFEQALSYLKQAYAKQAENEIASHIAEVMWVMGRHKEAAEFFDSVFKRSPEDEYLLKFKQHYIIQGD